ncbi:hypothetical protein VN1225_08460 [Helicobacter pylori]|nr:hypothetical protein VN1225_08460 [Helicobacter pylori]
MLADDFIVKKLKNKELHGLLCNKLSKRVDRFGYRVIGVGVDKETNEVIVQLNKETIVRLNSKTALYFKDSKREAVKITSRVFYELLMGTLFGNHIGKQAILMWKENNNK